MSEEEHWFTIMVDYDKKIKAKSYQEAKRKLIEKIENDEFVNILNNMEIFQGGSLVGSFRELEGREEVSRDE